MFALLIVAVVLSAIAVLLAVVLLMLKPEAAFAGSVRDEVERLGSTIREESRLAREESSTGARQLREELSGSVRAQEAALLQRLSEEAKQQLAQLQVFSTALTESSERGELRLAEMRNVLDERLHAAATAQQQRDAQTRQELQTALTDLTTRNEARLEAMRTTIEAKLTQVLAENEAKLERIRMTVDEKLHQTLEQRLGESFKLVSERLEQVHTGLGEMKSLAVGVGDLRKILTNVKTRGTWGEVQLGNLLEQTLTPDQFVRNFAPDEASADRVEFAIKLPGRDSDGNAVYLPIDSKFPHEEYQRLLEAQERGDLAQVEASASLLEQGIRTECKKISDKYLRPPRTTDFAILFVPTESLFAEILRRPGFSECIQRDHRIVVSGPTTLTALLTSLQMGFRTLAIEKRSSEVWKVLGAVKTEFGKFGEVLDKVHKKLTEASNTIEKAQQRSRAMERKLRPADELPIPDAAELLGIEAGELELNSAPDSDRVD
jgi:DNA recombination protein RmuC